MEKTKHYRRAKFSPECITEALDRLVASLPNAAKTLEWGQRSVTLGQERWDHDNNAEFFSDYRRKDALAFFSHHYGTRRLKLELKDAFTEISVAAPERALIEEVFAVFEKSYSDSLRPSSPDGASGTIFIGHGRASLWRDLKDHLHEKHGYSIQAYEIGARAGHTIRDILGEMLDKSGFALLVMTGEDAMVSGSVNPRLNVVHEAGLFQGRLGFERALVLLEDGAEEFSNIAGVQQIRFAKGNIKETFGEVLATLRREFWGA